MTELLNTERSYINDLEQTVNSFLVPMRGAVDAPHGIRGREEEIFCNLEEILKFHKEVFLKELEKYENMPEDVGHCFVTWVRLAFPSTHCKW